MRRGSRQVFLVRRSIRSRRSAIRRLSRWPWISPVLQRRVQFEAVAFAFAATALLTFTYGLLENVDFPRISLTWVLPLMIVLWTAGQAFRAASLRVARVRPRTPTR
jgi:hypothetical protein